MQAQYTKFISKFCTQMARQTGPVYYTGTIENITYYKLYEDAYYLRTKSSLDAARFYKDPAFAKSRERSEDFGGAAGLASAIYKLLPKKNRGRGFMGKLIGQVHTLLLKGKSAKEVQEAVLKEHGVVLPESKEPKEQVSVEVNRQLPAVPVEERSYTQLRGDSHYLQAFINALLDKRPVITALRI
jgi:hypothetical protein